MLVTVCRHGRQCSNEQKKTLSWGKQGKNTRPSNWRKNSKTNSFCGGGSTSQGTRGLWMQRERTVSSHPHKNTGSPSGSRLGTSQQAGTNDRGPAGSAVESAANEGISGSCRSRLEPGQVVPSSGDREERHKHNNRAGTASP